MTRTRALFKAVPTMMVIFFLVLFSGTVVSAADDAMIASYTAVWKTALAHASGITEKELEPLIEIKSAEITSWNSGKAFQVRYAIKIGWLTTEKRDCFTVWLNSSEDAYRHLPLPRDAWFTLPEIQTVLARQVFDTALGKVDPSAKLLYASLEEAKAFVMKKYGLSQLDKAEVAFYVPGKLPREDGMPYLLWSAVLDEKANKLREGYLNLVTGADESHENAIRMYGAPTGRGIVPGN